MSFSRIFRRPGEFLENVRKNSCVVGVFTFSCTSIVVGVPADTSNVVDVSTVPGIPAVAGLPTAVDVINVLIVFNRLLPMF